MRLEAFVHKPVWAGTLALLILILGIIGYKKLPVRLFPLVASSEVTITTTFPGASPQTMAGFVTIPIQKALAGLDGVNYIRAVNTEGTSTIYIHFFLKKGMIDTVLPQISNRVSSVMWKLPKEINSPIITKVNPNAGTNGAIMFYAFSSSTMPRNRVTDFINRDVISEIESIKGVASATIYGKRVYAMRVWLDPKKMAAFGVTASDVVNALRTESLQSTSGQIKGQYLTFNISTTTNLNTPQEFNNIIIRAKDNQTVRISDIGQAELGATENKVVGHVFGKPAITIAIIPQDNANSIQTADRVRVFFNKLKNRTPPGLKIQVLADMTQFNRKSISEVRQTIIESALFVFVVILLFLGSLRAVMIPVITMPLSLLGGTALMWIFGYSSNTLTMLAWVLAIGLVVDDAIVVLENIHRHMEEGRTRLEAAIDSIGEIKSAIVVMTLVVAVVFIPIGFIPGISGALFAEFSNTLAMVVIISGILALCITPVMCRYIMPSTNKVSRFTHWIDHLFSKIRNSYKHVLTEVLHIRWFIGIVFVGLIYALIHLFNATPSELIPPENNGVIIGIGFPQPGANIDYLQRWGKQFNTIYKKMPDKLNYGVFEGFPPGANQITSFVVLDTNKASSKMQDKLLRETQQKMGQVKGLFGIAVRRPILPGQTANTPVGFVLKTSGNYLALNAAMNTLLKHADKYPGLIAPYANMKMQSIQINVNLNRDKMQSMGISAAQVADTLATYFGKPVINRFNYGGRSYEVIPQVYRKNRYNPEDIKLAYVRSQTGQLVPLSSIATITESMTPNTLNQFQHMNSAMLSASLAPGYTLSQALQYLEHIVNTDLPKNVSFDYAGVSRQFVQSQGVLATAFAFAIVLIYLLLSTFFNSFREPFIVMLSVPLAITGALFIMFLTGVTLNIYTKIGLIMLVGLVSKHGILIVHFANQQQKEHGFAPTKAVIEAASIRLRPILMTTAAMIAGAIPLVLADGAGAEARQNIGFVIVGGMALGTLLTLFIVPAAYTLMAKVYKKQVYS